MTPANWIALSGVLSTAALAVFSVVWGARTEERVRRQVTEEQDALREKERVHAPQIEFDLAARFFGPQEGHFAVEIRMNLRNRGRVRQELRDPRLRILGLAEGAPFESRPDDVPRLEFPEKVMALRSVLPVNYRYFFVEPGVTQEIVFVTRVKTSVRYILVHGVFHYDETTPHTAERVFEVEVESKAPGAA